MPVMSFSHFETIKQNLQRIPPFFMPINTLIKNQVINTISDDFKIEAKYYTIKGVATTSHAVGEVDKKESWTKELSERKLIAPPSEGVDRYLVVMQRMNKTSALLVNIVFSSVLLKDNLLL
jgi:hypothetical protein